MTTPSSRPGSSRQNVHDSLFPTYVSNSIREEASSSSQLETWLETLENWKQRGFRFRIKCVRGKFYLTAYRKVNGKFLERSLGRISSEQLAILRAKRLCKD